MICQLVRTKPIMVLFIVGKCVGFTINFQEDVNNIKSFL